MNKKKQNKQKNQNIDLLLIIIICALLYYASVYYIYPNESNQKTIEALELSNPLISLYNGARSIIPTNYPKEPVSNGIGRSTISDQQLAYKDSCAPGFPEFEHKNVPTKTDYIFISIASYRDEACKNTVYELFEKAAEPDKIIVGVVQQNNKDKTKEDCFDSCEKCKKRKESGHIVVKNMDYLEAKGPAFARWAVSELWNGEEFYFQIDSHMKFTQDWDKIVKQEYRSTGDPKAIIGHYPPTKDQLEMFNKNDTGTTINCSLHFGKTKIPQQHAIVRKTSSKPIPQKYIGANCLFMPSTVLLDMPFDPFMVYLFFPEEIVYSARLWTHGYNMYAPSKPFCIHDYSDNKARPRYWNDLRAKKKKCERRAETRAEFFLGIRKYDEIDPSFKYGTDKYGMGDIRPLKDYWEFAGLDLHNKKAKNWC